MYDRFSDRPRRVMELANLEAQRFRHEYIGTEHVLMGLVRGGGELLLRVFADLGIALTQFEPEILKIVQPGDAELSTKYQVLPLTPRVKMIVEYAIEEARCLHQGQVGAEHLLLGILRDDACVASQVFMNLGFSLSKVRQKLLSLLPGAPTATDADLCNPDTPIVKSASGACAQDLVAAKARSYDLYLPVGDTPELAERVARRLMERIAGQVLISRQPMQSLSKDGKLTAVVVLRFFTDATEEARALVQHIKLELMAELSLDHLLVVETKVRRL